MYQVFHLVYLCIIIMTKLETTGKVKVTAMKAGREEREAVLIQ